MRRKRIVILGAGGMAREIAWLIRAQNRAEARYEALGYVVSDITKIGSNDSQEEILGDYEWLAKNGQSIDCVTVGIGTPAARLKVVREVKEILPHAEWPVLVHPTAILDAETARLGEGAQICAGVVATVNITLAPHALCNFRCTVGHETTIGTGSVINPGANISGGVTIGESVLVGTGAQILQYLNVGPGAIVGSGAVVTKDVAPGTTVTGIPAREINRS